MQEIWKDIDGYEGYYQVSNLGNVRSLTRKVWSNSHGGRYETRYGKILRPGKDHDGYLHVSLVKESTTKILKVHRLVAAAFIHNPNNYPVINHKNEVKDDNVVENLEWCSVKYNSSYGTCRKRIYQKQRKPIIGISMIDNSLIKFDFIRDAGIAGYNEGHLSECCHGKRPFHKGYYWHFAEFPETQRKPKQDDDDEIPFGGRQNETE